MLLLTLATLASEPVKSLCDQAALDARAAAANAEYTRLNMLDLMRSEHKLSDRRTQAYEGVVLEVGQHVRTTGNPGTVKPVETGHARELRIVGKTGTVMCFTDSRSGSSSMQLAVVRWDPAEWAEDAVPLDHMEQGRMYSMEDLAELSRKLEKEAARVSIGAFESTIHPSYLVAAP
ncbi:MAG: hypothetical protein R3F61_04290 [Myxococcota bacterium]